MEAGREMDIYMAKLMEYPSITTGLNYLPSMGEVVVYQTDGVWKFTPSVVYLWSPSNDISAAWEVVEETRKWVKSDPERWDSFIENLGFESMRDLMWNISPVTICRAALLSTLS